MTQPSTDSTNVVGYDSPNGVASSFAPDFDEPPPPPLPKVRRRKLPIATLLLALLAVGAAGFFVGVKVEKSKVPASTSNASAFGAAFGGATGARASGSPTAGPTGASSTPSAAAGGTGGSANIIGTVTVIDGTTLYVTDTTGDVVKVTTNTGTTVTKTVTGKVSDLAPGESVVIRGVQSSAGVYAAQSVSEGNAAAAFGGGGLGGGNFGGRGGRSTPAAPSASAGNN